jgi:hypothetical protein
MPLCYGCLRLFDDVADFAMVSIPLREGADDELQLEEPSDVTMSLANRPSPIRFHVAVPDLFGYDIYLDRVEGAQLTVGCARDNNIVLPHHESRRHTLRLYYEQGLVWAEDKGSTQRPLIEGTPLTGTRSLTHGTTLEIGEAKIELIKS